MKKILTLSLIILILAGCCKLPRDYHVIIRNSADINRSILNNSEYQALEDSEKVKYLEGMVERDIQMFENISKTIEIATK